MKMATIFRWAIGVWAVAFFVQPFVRPITTPAKWATPLWWVAAVLGVLWLWIACFNDWVSWRRFVRKEPRVPSVAPLVGGGLAWLIAILIPSCSACLVQSGIERFLLFVTMGTLDMGAIPFLGMGLARWIRNPGEGTG